jgi:DNA ligase D-like protein (predicted polymerase)
MAEHPEGDDVESDDKGEEKAAKEPPVLLEATGKQVKVTSPSKVMFPGPGVTKLELVQYYLAVAAGALVGVRDRPMALKRFPRGITGGFFFQKRAPGGRPPWVRTVTLKFPSGRTADEVVIDDAAGLGWLANLGCLDLNPHAVRSGDVEHPDELRIDLDPGEGVPFTQVKQVAAVVHELFDELGYAAYPKTSGSRGIHVNVRVEPKWGFKEVRRAALAVAREVERRAPSIATSKWWKEERHGVFLDFNQNAKDKTVASAYSVRPTADARVSAPFEWRELDAIALEDFTVRTVPKRFAEVGDPGRGLDERAFSLEPLLELVARHEAEGQGEAAFPPHYPKQEGEPARVQPSRAKKDQKKPGE